MGGRREIEAEGGPLRAMAGYGFPTRPVGGPLPRAAPRATRGLPPSTTSARIRTRFLRQGGRWRGADALGQLQHHRELQRRDLAADAHLRARGLWAGLPAVLPGHGHARVSDPRAGPHIPQHAWSGERACLLQPWRILWTVVSPTRAPSPAFPDCF
jgi:hypothetical protein